MSSLPSNDVTYVVSVIERLVIFHRQWRERLNFAHENRQHATYLVQGGCLTNTLIGLHLYELGYQNHVIQTIRFLFESRVLVQLFMRIKDDGRRLRAWFEDNPIGGLFGPGRAQKPKKSDLMRFPPEDPETSRSGSAR